MKLHRAALAVAVAVGLLVPVVAVGGALPVSTVFATLDLGLEAPTGVCATSTGNGVHLTWDAPTDPAVNGHVVEVRDFGFAAWRVAAVVSGAATSTDVGLPSTAEVRVAATASGGRQSDWGDRCVVAVGPSVALDDASSLVHRRIARMTGDSDFMTCYLTKAGGVLCHDLGHGIVPAAPVGGLLAGHTVVDVAAAGSSACALDSAHALFCWGFASGGLGDGSTTNSAVPVAATGGALAGQTVTEFDVGTGMTCALTSAGAVVCWGADGSNSPDPTPRVMTGALTGRTVVDLEVGGESACAITSTHDLICWGWNTDFLDPAVALQWFEPKVIDLRSFAASTITEIEMSSGHRCVLTDLGQVGCWGKNNWGQVGAGEATITVAPSLVQGDLVGRVVSELDVRDDRTCARTADGFLFCWGGNAAGAAVGSPRFTEVASMGGAVTGFTAMGTAGVWDGIATPSSRPSTPEIGPVSVLGRNVTLAHSASSPGAAPVTGYEVEGSDDNGVSWTVIPDVENSIDVQITAPHDGLWQFRLIAVSQSDAVGTVRSRPSQPTDRAALVSATPTTMSTTVRFVTDLGKPVVGAAVAWSTSSPGPSGSVAAVTDSTGAVSVTGVPSGSVQFALTHGTVAGVGSLTSGTYGAVLDPASAVHTVVLDEPTIVTRTVTVQMPNGRRMAGASLYGLFGGVLREYPQRSDDNEVVSNWDSGIPLPTVTGADGRMTITGFDAPTTGDDVLVSVARGPGLATFEFGRAFLNADGVAEIPAFAYLEVLSPILSSVDVGAAVGVRVRAVDAQGVPVGGVPVSLTTTNGKSASRTGCTQVVSGTTAVGTGELALRLCPSVGGRWVAAAVGFEPAPYAVPLAPAPVQVALSGSHTCIRRADRTVACVGTNHDGELGNGTSGSIERLPVKVAGLSNVGGVAVGAYFSCALIAPGAGGTVKCWGNGFNGNLGNGTRTEAQLTPVQVTVAGTGAPLKGVGQLDANGSTVCAVVSPGLNGAVYCWGRNEAGELGDGSLTDRSRAVRVKTGRTTALKGAVNVSVGEGMACALMVNGGVKCWGANSRGELGNGTTQDSRYAVQVRGIDGVAAKAASISAGIEHVCAVITNGTVRCWGANSLAQLGIGNTVTSMSVPTPVRISSAALLTGVRAVSVGTWNSCAIVGTGAASRVRCWGVNDHGELGVPESAPRVYATAVTSTALNGLVSLEVGPRQAMAVVPNTLRPSTAVVAWGFENAMELSLGGTGTVRTVPRLVKKL